jgi:nitrogen fixation/metabolism regulation signal transduction histidine kinase
MQGEPRPIEARGPREVVEAAAAFNRAIADLSSLRRRLAASERIAAWRETARHVAHEIKNPLAPIRAAIETLRRLRARNDPAFDEYFDEATRTALDEVGRINHIVSEFTRFARLPPPNPTDIDLVDVVRSVIGLHSSLGPEIRFEHADRLIVRADRDQVVQVMTNLLQNALDAVTGRPLPRVEVEVRPAPVGNAEIVVRDNGPGVPEALRSGLFQPYATTKAHGTGLGLAIAQRLVAEHGGEIDYRDANDGGAEFRILLPVRGPPAERPTMA